MDTRHYISPVIGAGTRKDAFRPAVANARVTWVAKFSSGDTECAVVVTADDAGHARCLAIEGVREVSQ